MNLSASKKISLAWLLADSLKPQSREVLMANGCTVLAQLSISILNTTMTSLSLEILKRGFMITGTGNLLSSLHRLLFVVTNITRNHFRSVKTSNELTHTNNDRYDTNSTTSAQN